MPALTLTEVAAGVHLASNGQVNWFLLTDCDAVTLVDAGYPADTDRVLASLHRIGRRPEDVVAVLITHAHVDHIGSLRQLLAGHPAPVLMGEEEVPHARREYLEQAGELDVLRHAWQPRVLLWSAQILRLGATKRVSLDEPEALPADVPLDLPGAPVPIATPGHTSGHTAYHLPEVGAVLTGDALITGHTTSARSGPQLLHPMFHHDLARATRTLDALADCDADLVLPGHGPAWHGTMSDAVTRARALARSGKRS